MRAVAGALPMLKLALAVVALVPARALALVLGPGAQSLHRLSGSARALERWPAERAAAWSRGQPWAVGANFIPSSAVNQLEMWQAETFDEDAISKELGYAEGIGMNMMRVFLHNMLYTADAEGFLQRVDRYLSLASKHGMTTMLVLFDGCWMNEAHLGEQPQPLKGRHNSRWLQAPTRSSLENRSSWPALQDYVKGVIGRFKDDPRVHSWDLYNEADNTGAEANMAKVFPVQLSTEDDIQLRLQLLSGAFRWAREVAPQQPVFAGEWQAMRQEFRDLLRAQSDIGAFHCYANEKKTSEMMDEMETFYAGRPLFLTEYMARATSSLFTSVLPIAKQRNIGAINWGLVAGKTNTVWPWQSWEISNEDAQKMLWPEQWLHDVFWPDGAPYNKTETDLISQLAADGSHPRHKPQ